MPTSVGPNDASKWSDGSADPYLSRWTLIAVCAATFILLVDVTIVQVALPTIQHHLHASFTDLAPAEIG